MNRTKVALIGAGAFGRNHARILSELPNVEFAGICDSNRRAAAELAALYRVPILDDAAAAADAAVIATPTITHRTIAAELLERGVDVLIEKPIAATAADGEFLDNLARQHGRILQVGHLERFNPAVAALQSAITVPLFFEVHRLSIFTPRSLDVDVVLDLMIHDLDIVLACVNDWPQEIRAAGISVLTPFPDIANVRLAFASGCVANLTASRISTEKVRKLRLFQPGEYISVDYQRQEAVRLGVTQDRANPISGGKLDVTAGEPLRLELESFIRAVQTRSQPQVTATQAVSALRLAEEIAVKIKEHSVIVRETVKRG